MLAVRYALRPRRDGADRRRDIRRGTSCGGAGCGARGNRLSLDGRRGAGLRRGFVEQIDKIAEMHFLLDWSNKETIFHNAVAAAVGGKVDGDLFRASDLLEVVRARPLGEGGPAPVLERVVDHDWAVLGDVFAEE
jgi:hypothetical protein